MAGFNRENYEKQSKMYKNQRCNGRPYCFILVAIDIRPSFDFFNFVKWTTNRTIAHQNLTQN
jgi:hypothetical protein